MLSFTSIPGVVTACVADAGGTILHLEGQQPTQAVLVLAQASYSAAGESGRRGRVGDCVEMLQRHEGGLIYQRGLPAGRLLWVLCEMHTDISALSHLAGQLEKQLTAAPPEPTHLPIEETAPALTTHQLPQNLADAFLAEPQSW